MLFKRKKNEQAPAQVTTPYIECRSWYGVSFHIRDTRANGDALCGYNPLDDKSTVTLEVFNERSKHQHAGWKYCGDCARIFALLHDDEKASQMIADVYSREAGRWCDRCNMAGSHHTDRHGEFVMAVSRTEKV